MTAVPAPAPASSAASAASAPSAVSGPAWPIIAVLFASTSVMVGVLWDISWHRSIGRDSFWTAAHLAIYAGGVVAGLACGWLALATTFGPRREAAPTVAFWRVFRAPLGAWVCIWGAFAMITSGPFDDWWHNAYGLDVEIISPPHVVLALGIITIQLGAMLMVLARQNNAVESGRNVYGRLFAYAGGMMLIMVTTMMSEYSGFPNNWHAGEAYRVALGALPLFMVAFGRAGRLAWPATTAAAIYLVVQAMIGWILQLFPAQPRLAPILNPISHMVPTEFPMLLVVPAIGVDLVLRAMRGKNGWLTALAVGPTFAALLIGSHWVFGEFLLSPAGRNPVFHADRWAYQARPGPWMTEFWDAANDPVFTGRNLGVMLALALVSTRLGLWWGDWMARVRR